MSEIEEVTGNKFKLCIVFRSGVTIRLELQLPPEVYRDIRLWHELGEVEKLAGTKDLLVRSTYSHYHKATTITVTSPEAPNLKGESTFTDAEYHRNWSRMEANAFLVDQIRFAAWKLIHDGDSDDDDDE